jgi:chromosome segregation protein
MRIQRLDICGFKSFNERVILTFDRGITGIVGPNGCGKSNVVDALRWVMGEQSARQLRGGAMADLLFNGSERVGPAGLAEVSLTLLNDRQRELPGHYQQLAEINIKRRLYRSGESEYRINNESCRLMDITELLLGTGAGKRAYSIIEQGKVGLIVNASPEERRALLEEAAGISKYRWRKHAAERKLAATEQNLLRVSDVVAELRRQLGSLERQARKAVRYRRLKDEWRELELQAAAMSWLSFHAQRGHLRRAVDKGARLVEECRRGQQSLQTERFAKRQVVEQADAALAAELQRRHTMEKELQRSEQLAGFAQREGEALVARTAGLRASLEALQRRSEEAREEEHALASLVDVGAREMGEAERMRLDAEADLHQLELAAIEDRRVLDAHRHAAIEAAARLSSGKRELVDISRRVDELAVRLARFDGEGEQLTERRAELVRCLEEASSSTDQTQQLQLRLESERGDLEHMIARTHAALASEEAELAALAQNLAAERSRLQSLNELHRSHEDSQEGVRTLMRAREEGNGPRGLRALVADVFEAPAEIETALEGYLGDRLQDLVVENGDAGLAALSFLREKLGGRGTFIPLDILVGSAAGGLPVAGAGIVGRAVDLVRVSPGAERLSEALLGRAWVVSDFGAALRVRAAGSTADLVTLDGEVLFANGVVTGGRSAGVATGVLHRRREADELNREIGALEGRQEAAKHAAVELRVQIKVSEESLREVSRGGHEKEISLAHQQQEVRRMREQLHACEEQLVRLVAERAEVELARSDSLLARSGVDSLVLQAESALAESRAASEIGERSLGGKLDDLQRAQARLTDIQVKLAADAEKRAATLARIQRLAEATLAIETEREASATAVAAAETRRTALQQEGRDLEMAIERLRSQVEISRTMHASLAVHREACVAALTRLEEREEQQRKHVDQEQQSHSALLLALRERDIEIAHLEEVARELHGVDLGLEVTRHHLGPLPANEAANRLKELKTLIAAMGEINLSAIEEHRELEDRHEKLSGQQLDLQRAVEQLREAIGRISRQSQRRFRETFALVNERFGQVFPRMFGGGRASLSLVGEDGDVPEGGVEIFAQPPGKKLQSIDLLSGGEKALTAVALVFSIFLIKPTPFCLLDEVDAPLDEANVARYLQALREMSDLSQFILITHNKRTMEAADTLYGITMEEPGCSKLVSVKLNRPAASAA